ncbi:HNH endonuclease [Pseudoclavibacter chungangensis]|uniref:HNH endonuclease n=1 Tax=Pseudoclavibacter chungangensis TaxID=587635 RepID=A0A7J5C0G0_9MICO|nr:HNH endonuclease [Pseudoclavibacter chungangensis]KAB1660377.1 HNH endonuclease [Pseudoclavibacter chungangensis]NYJ65741.1 5-methylcytosine-specific restriction endonuclease McrA [Pseudoclavibacter chungangensis]
MRTLVLNAGFEPLGVVTDRRALTLVMNGRASVLDVDEERPVRSVEGSWPRPVVILLRRYVKVPMARVSPVSRRGVLRRDDHRCGYCDAFANTIDHILPRSRGGAHSWENLVACCLTCNNVKGDRTPAEMGWRLRRAPVAPRGVHWTGRGIEHAQPEWAAYLPAA